MSLAAAASTIGQCTSCTIVGVVFLQPRDGGAALGPLSLVGSSGTVCLRRHRRFEASQQRGCNLPPLVCESLPSSTERCLLRRRCLMLGLATEERLSATSSSQSTTDVAGLALVLIAPASHGFVPQVCWLGLCLRSGCPVPKTPGPRPPLHFAAAEGFASSPPFCLVSVDSCAVCRLECRDTGVGAKRASARHHPASVVVDCRVCAVAPPLGRPAWVNCAEQFPLCTSSSHALASTPPETALCVSSTIKGTLCFLWDDPGHSSPPSAPLVTLLTYPFSLSASLARSPPAILLCCARYT